MHAFRQQFKQLLTFFLFIAFFSTYPPAFAETAEPEDHGVHRAQTNRDWPGVYHGFLPCDDCRGIKSILALNTNNSYILITREVGKSEREIVEKGKFTSGDKSNTIILTSRDNSTTRQYFVGKDILSQLDSNGDQISGKLADRYILRRTDVTGSSQPHSSH